MNNKVQTSEPDQEDGLNYLFYIEQIKKTLRSGSTDFKRELDHLYSQGTSLQSVNIIIATLVRKTGDLEGYDCFVKHINKAFRNTKQRMSFIKAGPINKFKRLLRNNNFCINDQFDCYLVRSALDLILEQDYFNIFRIFAKVLDFGLIDDHLLKDQKFVRVVNSKYINFIFYLMRTNNQVVSEIYIDMYYVDFNILLQKKDELTIGCNYINDFLIRHRYEDILIQTYQYEQLYVEISQKSLQKLYANDFVVFLEMFYNFNQNNKNYFLQKDLFKTMMSNQQSDRQFMFQLEMIYKLSIGQMNPLTSNQQYMLIMKYDWLAENPEHLESRFINQLYVLCMIYVLLNNLITSWNKWNIQINRLKEKYMTMILDMVDKIDDDYSIKLILFYPHVELDNKPLVTFIQEHDEQFIDLLNQEKIARSILFQWKGNRESYYNFINETYMHQKMSSSHIKIDSQGSKVNCLTDQKMSADDKQQQIDRIQQIVQENKAQPQKYNIFSILKNKVNKQEMNRWKQRSFFYQFDIYNNNLQNRRYLDFIVLVIVFVIFFYIVESGMIILSESYQTWDTKYSSVFEYTIPSDYSSFMTINENEKQVLQEIQRGRTNPESFMQYCGSLFSRVYTFTSAGSTLKTTLVSYCSKFSQFTIFVYQYNQSILFLFFLMMNLVFKSIIKIIYSYLINNKKKASTTVLLDIAVLCIIISLMVKTTSVKSLKGVSDDQLTFYAYVRNGSIPIIVAMYILLIKATRTFPSIGFQVLILVSIVKKISYFLIFYIIIILGFTMIFYISFGTLDTSTYPSYADTFIVVFSNPLGSYTSIADSSSYSTLKSANVQFHNFASIALQFYMMVVFLNVVIAILNNIYEELEENSRKEYSLVIYDDYVVYTPDQYLSAIINVPDILSTFSLMIVPLLKYSHSAFLNRAINIFWYFIYMVIPFLALHMAINFIMLPFVYLQTLVQILFASYRDQFNQKTRVFISTRIIYFLSYLIFGIFHLFYEYFVDFMHISSKLFKRIQERHNLTFGLDIYKSLKRTVVHFDERKQHHVSYEEFQPVVKEMFENIQQQNIDKTLSIKKTTQIKKRMDLGDELNEVSSKNFFAKLEDIYKEDGVDITRLKRIFEDVKTHLVYYDQEFKYESKLKLFEIMLSKQKM